MKIKLSYALIGLSVAFFVVLLHLYKVDPFESFALRFNDINFTWQTKKISKKVVFVAIDEPSVNRFGRWPWDRKILAQGIEKLYQADVVMMDMIFSEPTNEEADAYLGDALASLNGSVCGFFLRQNATQDITDEELEILSDSSLDLLMTQVSSSKEPNFLYAPYAEMNIPVIMQGCSLNGSFTTVAAADHLFRSYPVAVYFQGVLYPSLAIQALRLVYDQDIEKIDKHKLKLGDRVIPVDQNGLVRLNFYHYDQYKIISFLDVYNGKIKPEFFKGKMVVLGITEVGAGDVAPTPIGNIPGPLLHYTFLSNFLENQLIKEYPLYEYVLIVSMAFLPLLLVFFIRSVLFRTLINIFLYLLVYLVGRYLFIKYNIYIDLFFPLIAFLLALIGIEVVAFMFAQRDERFLKDAFSSYLSGDLMQELIKNPQALRLGGEKKELSILFSDIRSFTTISESITPEELIKLLNRYFTPMTNAVLEKKGMLDKYIGDAVMAFFNAPVDVPDHADKACESALLMIERLRKLNKELVEEGLFEIHIGIGINTAEVIVGNMGSDTRFNYTVIGDGVNLASRVEGLTKNYGVNILITEFTVRKLQKRFLYRKIEPVQVKGKEEAVVLYELMEDTPKNQAMKKLYDEALEHYIDGDLKKAKHLFKTLLEEFDDSVSRYFLHNIQNDHLWGVHKMKTK